MIVDTLTPTQLMLSSGAGALLTSLSMTPLDVVKTRMQAQQKQLLSNKCFLYCNGLMDHICSCVNGHTSDCDANSKQWYRRPGQFTGTIDAMIKISRTEGVFSLWSGLPPTLVMAVPATMVYFTFYETIRDSLFAWYKSRTPQHPEVPLPMWVPLIAAMTARAGAVTLVSPLELVRTKMQAKKMKFSEIRGAVQNAVKTYGYTGMWRGLNATLLRDIPFSALYWPGYEILKRHLTPPGKKDTPLMASFIAGSVSGTFAAVVTLPFDVVKTHRQIELGEKVILTDKPDRCGSTFSTMRRIQQQQGIRGLFAGLTPRVAKVAPACAIMISTFECGKAFFKRRNAER